MDTSSSSLSPSSPEAEDEASRDGIAMSQTAKTTSTSTSPPPPPPLDPSSSQSSSQRQPPDAPPSSPPPLDKSRPSHPLGHEQEHQDNEFIHCETEYLETLSSITSSDDPMVKFKQEYDKMHKAILLSRRHTAVMFQQFHEMYTEHTENASLALDAVRMAGADKVVLENLKEQIKRNEDVLDACGKREDADKAALRNLRYQAAFTYYFRYLTFDLTT
jgi:hypothetical protein